MNDEYDQIINFCTDLVTQKRTEPFVTSLLRNQSIGEWVRVIDKCRQMGLEAIPELPGLVATWLSDPSGDKGYIVIIFYDDDTKQSFAAHYNKQRLIAPDDVGAE